jgi:hypothetical protein
LKEFARLTRLTFGFDQPAMVMVASQAPNPIRPSRLYQVNQRKVFVWELLSKREEIHAVTTSAEIERRSAAKSAHTGRTHFSSSVRNWSVANKPLWTK